MMKLENTRNNKYYELAMKHTLTVEKIDDIIHGMYNAVEEAYEKGFKDGEEDVFRSIAKHKRLNNVKDGK